MHATQAPCELCARMRTSARAVEAEGKPLSRSRSTTLYEGPFASRWPGALMVVSNRHVEETTDLRPPHARAALLDVLDAERAVRLATGCARVNVVKFGNVASHLHWHVIPRYLEEAHRRLTPWEILQAHSEGIYVPDKARTSRGLLVDPPTLRRDLVVAFEEARANRSFGTFGAALFVRPADPGGREATLAWPLPRVREALRSEPAGWESFLMQRNYLDRAWDHFGGNGEPGEFPEDTMRREVREELGWEVGDALEITRQWEGGLLRGMLFLARPSFGGGPLALLSDTPPRAPCDEVAAARWVNIAAAARGEAGVTLAHGVRERHAAVARGAQDTLSADC